MFINTIKTQNQSDLEKVVLSLVEMIAPYRDMKDFQKVDRELLSMTQISNHIYQLVERLEHGEPSACNQFNYLIKDFRHIYNELLFKLSIEDELDWKAQIALKNIQNIVKQLNCLSQIN